MVSTKVERKLYVREWIFPLMFVLFALIFEMVNFLTLDFGVLPTYLIFDVAVICLFLGILFLFRVGSVAWICVASFFLLIQVVLNIANATLYEIFGEIFSVSILSIGGEGADSFDPEFLNYFSIFINLFIWAVFIASAVYLSKNTEMSIKLNKKSKFIVIISAFVALQACGFSLFNGKVISMNLQAESERKVDNPYTDEELWGNTLLKNESFKQFGTYGFYAKNLEEFFFEDKEMSEENQQKVSNALSSGENYLAQSKYSGIGKDDNLIVLMLESFDTFTIDPIYTPFLWSMRNGEFAGAQYMESFYARNKTNISEEISILGHIATTKLYSTYYSSVGLSAPYSLPNLLKNDGATAVNYFHGYKKSFYDRENVNVALGFDNVYGIEDCSLEDKTQKFGDWILDSEYIKNMIDLFIHDGQRFYSQYTTIATHGPYDVDNYRISENMQFVEDNFDKYLGYVNNYTSYKIPTEAKELRKFKQYKAFAMDTDKMIQYIFQTLADKNLLDSTTVVIFADHNAFYSDLCYDVKGTDKMDASQIESNHIPCIIYNDKLVNDDGSPLQPNQNFCSTYDIYPTICDLLGLPYNSALVQGYSIFSEDSVNSLFVSAGAGMINKDIYTSNIKDFVKINENVSEEDIKRFTENILKYYQKQEIVELIYQYNYFKNYA